MARKWVYKPGHPDANERGFVEYDLVREETNTARQVARVDLYMDGTRTIDGAVDIGSKRKRREYMNKYGVVDGNDFSTEYIANKKRMEALSEKKERREAIARAFWEVNERRK